MAERYFIKMLTKVSTAYYQVPVWGFLPGILFLQGCCSCTEMACFTEPFPEIELQVDILDYPELEQEDLENVIIIQTDSDYNKLDSLSSGFVPVAFESTRFILSVDFNMFNTSDQLSKYHYLIHNIRLNQIDTISHLSYDVTTSEEVCNECSGGLLCEDETYTVYDISNPGFDYNKVSQDSFDVNYVVK